jgi:uncharacterized protein YraI
VRFLTLAVLIAAGVGGVGMQAIIERDGSNLRQGPGTDYPVVRTVLSGESFPVLSTKGNWLRLGIDADTEAWIRSDLVRVVTRGGSEAVEAREYPESPYVALFAVVALGLGLALLFYHVLVARQRDADYRQRLERLTGPAYVEGITAADVDRLRRAFGVSTGKARRLYHRIYRDKFDVSRLKPMTESEREKFARLQAVLGLSEREVGLITSQSGRSRRS